MVEPMMPRLSMYGVNLVLIVIVLFTFIALLAATEDTRAALTLDPEDISTQLLVQVPKPIHRESAGALDLISVDDSTIVGWLAKSKAFMEYPAQDPTGNIVYLTIYDRNAGSFVTKYLSLGNYTIKSDLRIAQSPSGGIRLFWIENNSLWDCESSFQGDISDMTNTLTGSITGYDLVGRRDKIDVYSISNNSHSISWLMLGSARTEVTDVTSFIGSITDIRSISFGDHDLLIVNVMNTTTNEDTIHYMLVKDGMLADTGTLATGFAGPVALDLTSSIDRVYSAMMEETTGHCSFNELTKIGTVISVGSSQINTTFSPTSNIRILFENGRIQVFSINMISFPSVKKLQRYRVDPATHGLDGPENITSVGLSLIENSFSTIIIGDEVQVVLAEQYFASPSVSYSKILLFQEGSEGFVPLALLNPRSDFVSSASSIDALTDDMGRHWLAATLSTNGSTEIHIYRVSDASRGVLEWVASTPWWSAKSRMNGKMTYGNGTLFIAYETVFEQDSRADICLMSLDPRTNDLSAEVILKSELYIYSQTTTWEFTSMEPNHIILATVPMLRALDMTKFEIGAWIGEPWTAIEMDERVYQFSLGSYGDSVFLFTLEHGSANSVGAIRTLKESSGRATVVDTVTFLSADYSVIPEITVGSIGGSEYSILIKTDFFGVEDRIQLMIFDAENQDLGPIYPLHLPKAYRIFGTDVAPLSNDYFMVSYWGLDVERFANEAQRILELNLAMIDRGNPADQGTAIPFAITGLGRGSFDIGPELALLTEGPSRCVVPFLLFGVGDETNKLFSIAFDFAAQDLTPLAPKDGSILNDTFVKFLAMPVGDLWESMTSYQVRIFKESDPGDPFYLSDWSSYPAHDLVLPSGTYMWKYVYKRFSSFVESSWTWKFIIDTNPPIVETGGPYLNATVGSELTMNASKSSDENGILLYRWTILQEPRIALDSNAPTVAYTPNRIGLTSVLLEVMDGAGNWARTSTVIFARPPPPELEVTVPDSIYEGREFSLVCTVTNAFGEIDYYYIWKIASWGGVSSEFNMSVPDNGDYAVSLDVFDTFGQNASWKGSIVVQNLPPEVDALPDLVIYEFERQSIVPNVTDVPADSLTYAWMMDGVGISTADRLDLSLNHGKYNIGLRVEDDDGGISNVSFNITSLARISQIFVQGNVNISSGELTVSWAHAAEIDYRSVEVDICSDKDGRIHLRNFTTTDQDIHSHVFSIEGLPETVYVYAVLYDDSMESRSDLVEVPIQASLVPPHTNDDWKIQAFWVMLLLLILSIAITSYYVYKGHQS